MVRRPLRWLLAATLALTGCSALLDVKDIYFDPSPGAATAEPTGPPTQRAVRATAEPTARAASPTR